jgi:hypothetical protein
VDLPSNMTVNERIEELEECVKALWQFLHVCIKRYDLHGVMDASADIRELEAEIRCLKSIARGEYPLDA